MIFLSLKSYFDSVFFIGISNGAPNETMFRRANLRFFFFLAGCVRKQSYVLFDRHMHTKGERSAGSNCRFLYLPRVPTSLVAVWLQICDHKRDFRHFFDFQFGSIECFSSFVWRWITICLNKRIQFAIKCKRFVSIKMNIWNGCAYGTHFSFWSSVALRIS